MGKNGKGASRERRGEPGPERRAVSPACDAAACGADTAGRLGEAVKTRKKTGKNREKMGEKWARYGLKRAKGSRSPGLGGSGPEVRAGVRAGDWGRAAAHTAEGRWRLRPAPPTIRSERCDGGPRLAHRHWEACRRSARTTERPKAR